MSATAVVDKFVKIGARATLRHGVSRPAPRAGILGPAPEEQPGFTVDISEDGRGEFFEISAFNDGRADFSVLDVDSRNRHLLLMVREEDKGDGASAPKHKFLCGHDERHWFVAAVPGESVRDIRTAMEALKPELARESQQRRKVKLKHRDRRRNHGFVRQGEWFFVPVPGFVVNSLVALKAEPLVRGQGKPHIAEYLFRRGGETVYVSRTHPNGLTEDAYRSAIRNNPRLGKQNWQVMRRNPEVYVKGRISHPDHKTVVLDGWHRVAANTETETPAMANVAFLD